MKRVPADNFEDRADAFPPVNSGGLIEAYAAPAAAARSAGAFPPVNSGGLIEASILWMLGGRLNEFPPVNSGGLIEALCVKSESVAENVSFRR